MIIRENLPGIFSEGYPELTLCVMLVTPSVMWIRKVCLVPNLILRGTLLYFCDALVIRDMQVFLTHSVP